MPANDRLWSNNDKVISPLRPQPGKGDPERSIEGAQSRSRPFLGIDRELLPEGQLDDGLFLPAPEEGAQAMEKSDREVDQRPHESRMVHDRVGQNETESRNPSGVSSVDGCEGLERKAEQYQRGRILRTHRYPQPLSEGCMTVG